MELVEIKQIVQERIDTILKETEKSLTPSDYKDICNNKQCWKKFLWEDLDQKDKVIDFSHQIEKIIDELVLEDILKNQESSILPLSLKAKWTIGTVVVGGIIVATLTSMSIVSWFVRNIVVLFRWRLVIAIQK